MKVTVVGSGTWGTTLAIILARKSSSIVLLARTAEEASMLRSRRENVSFLPGVAIPESLEIEHLPERALSGAGMAILAVPAQTVRENVISLWSHLESSTIVVCASKGLEVGSCLRMSEVIASEMGSRAANPVLAVSGPNIAREVVIGLPATTVVAGADGGALAVVQETLSSPTFRVYTNKDIVGVELGGALKNVIALAAGICDGLRAGENAKAGIITRGLAEMARLGVAAGARQLTFIGLAGLGDLVATCSSQFSRNRYVGEQLANGRSLDDIQASMSEVAEGVPTTLAACELAARLGVEMPIAALMKKVLFEGKNVRDASHELMTRQPRSELYGLDT